MPSIVWLFLGMPGSQSVLLPYRHTHGHRVHHEIALGSWAALDLIEALGDDVRRMAWPGMSPLTLVEAECSSIRLRFARICAPRFASPR